MGSFGFFPLAFSISWDQQKVKGTKAEPKKKKKAALLNPVLPERTVGNFFGGERSMCSPLWASQNCQKMWIFCFQNSMRKRKNRNKWEG